jgi:hypothetical protein
MKRLHLVLTLAALLPLFAGTAIATDAELYKIVSGTTVLANGEQMPVILKIHTISGQTWQLVNAPINGNAQTSVPRWLAIDDTPLRTMPIEEPAPASAKKFDPSNAKPEK